MNARKEFVKKGSAASRTLVLPGCGSVVGYIRVSSASQDHATQRHAIELAARARGEAIERWFADTATGGTMDRPELVKLRAELARGAVSCVWVWKLNRISRSGMVDTLSFVDEVRRSGARLVSVSENFPLDGPASQMVIAALAFAAELEREQIRENQLAARARLEAAGRTWGRPPLPPHKRDAAALLASQGKSPKEIARELQISRTAAGKIVRAQKRQM